MFRLGLFFKATGLKANSPRIANCKQVSGINLFSLSNNETKGTKGCN